MHILGGVRAYLRPDLQPLLNWPAPALSPAHLLADPVRICARDCVGSPLLHLHGFWRLIGPRTDSPCRSVAGRGSSATSAPGLTVGPTSALGPDFPLGVRRSRRPMRSSGRPSTSRWCAILLAIIYRRFPLTADPTYGRSHLRPIPLTADPTYGRSHLRPIPVPADPTNGRSH
jgi:hypothetical protein